MNPNDARKHFGSTGAAARSGAAAALLLLSLGLSAVSGHAADRIPLEPLQDGTLGGRLFKAQNGFLLAWLMESESPQADQIVVFDAFGKKVLALNPLSMIPEARLVSISDVSVGPTGMIAVAAVMVSREEGLAASLLLFSSAGSLLRAFSLSAETEVLGLAVDEDENIWALGVSSGEADPALVPLVFKYDKQGKLIGQYLPRSEFAANAKMILEGDNIGGFVGFGLSAGDPWVWLPSTRELITFHRDGTGVRNAKTGLPSWTGPDAPGNVLKTMVYNCQWTPGGTLVADVIFTAQSKNRRGTYLWDTGTQTWKEAAEPDASSGRAVLAGVDGTQLVYVWHGEGGSREVERRPFLPM